MYSLSELHGNVINYNDIKKIPDRDHFLDKDLYKNISNDINFSKTLLFMPSSIHETNLQNKESGDWKSKYCIVLFGILMDGRRATVVIEDIKPYFEIMMPECDDISEKASEIYNLLKNQKLTSHSFELNKFKQFKGYNKNKRTFVKFYFDNLKNRVDAIKFVRERNYETTSDDLNSYYRVVCRDNMISFSSWVNISNYTVKTYQKIRGKTFRINIKNYKLCMDDITENPMLSKDNIMTLCWDIETYSSTGELPIPEIFEHKMFMIGLTFQWHHSDSQILRICLVDMPSKPKPDFLTVVCGTEKKLIKAFAKIFYKFKPEYVLGFNDGDYDWPWLIKRGSHYKGVLKFMAENMDHTVKLSMVNEKWTTEYNDNDVMKYNFKKEKTKLEADAYADGYSLQFPGFINVDVRTIFRQLYPTAEKSNLNFYLALNKLGGKKDMPYQEIFDVYKKLSKKVADNIKDNEYDTLVTTMGEISEYCIIDSQRCHELMKIRSVIMDRREIAVMSFTSMYDSFYRANGMKVRNLVIARGQQLGIRFSNITNDVFHDTGKYPGAYVFPPKKGLVVSKLSIKELINSNLEIHKEWKMVTPDELDLYYKFIDNNGPFINELKLDANNFKQCFVDFLSENTGRPITGLDFASLYPSLIMAYNLSPEFIITNKKEAEMENRNGTNLFKIKFLYGDKIIRGWSIRHDNLFNGENSKFGVYPTILKELFDLRNQMKKGLHKWESAKEKLETMNKDEFNTPEIQAEYNNICFNFRYIDSKQRALKVFMNTFYGESGNKRSPFFIIQLAGAITSSGQENIKMVQKFVENKKCNVYYGDSVSGDTPLLIRDSQTGVIMIKTIDDLNNEDEWQSYDQFKPNELDRIQKQQSVCPLQIWTENNWYDIKRVIRHKTNKKMYRVNTHTGCIDVTEDHSLLTPDKRKIKPSDIVIGTELYHSFPNEFPEIFNSTKENAYIWGFFMANGSCDYKLSSNKITWEINNQNLGYLNQLLEYLIICEPYLKFKVSYILDNLGFYKLIAIGDINLIVEKYKKLFYDKRNCKIVPIQILNGSNEIRQSFYNGYYNGYGYNQQLFYFNSKITAQCMYYLVKSLGYKYVTISNHLNKTDMYWINFCKIKFDKNPITVKKILELPDVTNNTFVYDIETERGSFLGGIGEINVKNTDSLYCSMPESHFYNIDLLYYTDKINKLEYWNRMVDITFQVIVVINNEVNNMLINDNGTNFLKMAFEESLFPVAFLAKKKYYGIPHITVPNFQPKNLFIRGLEVKKRGVSDVMKKVCMDIMWDSVSYNNIYTLINLVENKIKTIYSTKWDFTDFIITDVFKPTKKNVKVHTFVNRMKLENIDIKPYERFPYVIVNKYPYKYDERGRKIALSIGDKMELAEVADRKKLSIDLDYYMQGSINGQLSRLITYHPSFQAIGLENEEMKIIDDKTYDNSCKYIDNICSKYYTKYNLKNDVYKKIYKISSNIMSNKLNDHCNLNIIKLINTTYDIDDIENWILTKIECIAKRNTKKYGEQFVKAYTDNTSKCEKNQAIISLQNSYYVIKNNLLYKREEIYKKQHMLLISNLKDKISDIIDILKFNEGNINDLSDVVKKYINIDNLYNSPIDSIKQNADDLKIKFEEFNPLNDETLNELNEIAENKLVILINNENLNKSLQILKKIYIEILCNYNYIYNTRSIVEYLKLHRDIKLRNYNVKFDKKTYINNSVNDIINSM